jgi:hypothetical protein
VLALREGEVEVGKFFRETEGRKAGEAPGIECEGS